MRVRVGRITRAHVSLARPPWKCRSSAWAWWRRLRWSVRAVLPAVCSTTARPNVDVGKRAVFERDWRRVVRPCWDGNVHHLVRTRDSVGNTVFDPAVLAPGGERAPVGHRRHVDVEFASCWVLNRVASPRGEVRGHAVSLRERNRFEVERGADWTAPRLIANARAGSILLSIERAVGD